MRAVFGLLQRAAVSSLGHDLGELDLSEADSKDLAPDGQPLDLGHGDREGDLEETDSVTKVIILVEPPCPAAP